MKVWNFLPAIDKLAMFFLLMQTALKKLVKINNIDHLIR
jgi:hypothetical protein